MPHEPPHSIPAIPQNNLEGEFFSVERVVEHVADMLQCGLAVAVLVKDAVGTEPKLAGLRVDINASDKAAAFNDGFSIATVLAAHQFDGAGVIFKRVIYLATEQKLAIVQTSDAISGVTHLRHYDANPVSA